MTRPKHREVRPQAAQSEDGTWEASALVFYEVEGTLMEEEASWPEKRFGSPKDALNYAKQAGEAWLDKQLGS